MFIDCRSLPIALKCFMKLQHRNVHSWTAVMQGLYERGECQSVLQVYQHMKAERMNPCSYTFVALLKACSSLKDARTAQFIHTDIIQTGHECIYVCTALVNMYMKCGLFNEATDIFEKLSVRNIVTWNCLFAGYADYGACTEVFQSLERMTVDGIQPDIVTLVSILKVCANRGLITVGQTIHLELTKKGKEMNPYAGNVLVDMYVRCSLVLEAQNVFNRMPHRDYISWTTLIAGYADHGAAQEALNFFQQLQSENISLDAPMFTCALRTCGNIGAKEKGLEFHVELYKKGMESNVFIGSTLVDMYAKWGCLTEAHEVLNGLPQRNVVCWNAMINGCGMNEDGDSALDVFEGMRGEGIKPDATTFLCLLSACNHVNLVHKGQEFFQAMGECYNISPSFGHLMCVTGLFARSGQLWEAGKFLSSLPCHPSKHMLIFLLSACKTYIQEITGCQCFDQLIQSS
ncbi:hypothetical protein KP509_02G002600 [Ceratopteris richardii]|nr:hypothetical protein KP509_02G002600 [Ceratopteris richardii]